jgi:topoisomerase IV subunit A
MVQKSKLIERVAELLNDKKLPLLGDIRDESAEDVRIVLEPKTRNVDPTLMMEQLFRASEFETRFPLNMNVLSGGKVPKVMSLRDILREWLDHRKDVLVRGTNFRLGEIARRLEILEGYLIAYLNLDEVIRIIREEDEPKPALMKRFKLTDNQAEAILNMRLRALRKLEEMEIRTEHDKLTKEQKGLKEGQGNLQQENPARPQKNRFCRSTRCCRRARRNVDRERTHHRGLLRKGLDTFDEGPPRRHFNTVLQGW